MVSCLDYIDNKLLQNKTLLISFATVLQGSYNFRK